MIVILFSYLIIVHYRSSEKRKRERERERERESERELRMSHAELFFAVVMLRCKVDHAVVGIARGFGSVEPQFWCWSPGFEDP